MSEKSKHTRNLNEIIDQSNEMPFKQAKKLKNLFTKTKPKTRGPDQGINKHNWPPFTYSRGKKTAWKSLLLENLVIT